MKGLAANLIAAGLILASPVGSPASIDRKPKIDMTLDSRMKLHDQNAHHSPMLDNAVSIISIETYLRGYEKEGLVERAVKAYAPGDYSMQQKLLNSRTAYSSIEEVLIEFFHAPSKVELMKLLERALDDLQKHPESKKTRYALAMPEDTNGLISSNHEKIQINIVEEIFYRKTNKVNFHDFGKDFEETISENSPYLQNYRYSLSTSKNTYSLDKIIFGTSIIAHMGNMPGLMMSLATNFYIHKLVGPTIEHIIGDMNSLSARYGRPLTEGEKISVDKLWRQRHLIASCSLANLWMEGFGMKNLNIRKEDVKYIHAYPKEFDDIRDLASKMGLKMFLDFYANNPKLIFNHREYKGS